MTPEDLKRTIFEAFKDVPKGQALGVRECAAMDSYAGEADLAKAKAQDVEQHWWEYPDNVKETCFDYTLAYSNRDGIRFHLPALMTAAIDGVGNIADVSVFMFLCTWKVGEKAPHQYHPPYVSYLKSFDVSKHISYYEFNEAQVHAIALYLLWGTSGGGGLRHFFQSRKDMIAAVKLEHDNAVANVPKEHYTLTLDDAVAVVDEVNRIVYDWLAAGNVEISDMIFPGKE